MSKTITQIIVQTFATLNQKWSLFMSAGAVQLLFSLSLLLLFPPFGFVLAWATFAITSVHLAGHNLKRLENKKTKLQNIFTTKNYFAILTTKLVRLIQVAFWSIFLLVPGIWMALDYSMLDFLLFQSPNQDGFEALEQSASLVKNNKGKLFVFWMLYVLLSALIFIFACSILVIIKWFTALPNSVAATLLFFVFAVLFVIVVLPFVHVSQALIFDDLTQTAQKQQGQNRKSETNIIDEQ